MTYMITFDTWMRSKDLSESTVKKYYGAIRGSLTDWAREHNLIVNSILNIRDPSEISSLVQKFKKLDIFQERNIRAHSMYFAALKKYSKYLYDISDSSYELDIEKRRKFNKPWLDDELRVSVDAYLYMLRLESSNIYFSTKDIASFLTNGPLSERNDASIRYRMRNISYVLFQNKLPTLKAFSPAYGVGSGVEKRIKGFLSTHSENLTQLIENNNNTNTDTTIKLSNALSHLDKLEKNLLEIQKTSNIGIGHNNPPERIEKTSLDIADVKKSVTNIQKELKSSSPNKDKIEQEQNVLVQFGLGIVTSTKMSVSIFTKATIASAGATVGATILAPNIIATLEAVASFVQTLK